MGGPVPLGRAPWANAHPDDRAKAERAWRNSIDSSSSIDIEVSIPSIDDQDSPLRFLANPRLDADGSITGYSGVVIAMAAHQQLFSHESGQLLALLESSDDPTIITDMNGVILHANEAASHFDQMAVSVRDQMPREILSTPNSNWRGEVGLRGSDNELHTFDVQVACANDRITMLARDISSSLRLQAELAHLATHDALTRLPNRTLFIRKLSEAIERALSATSTVSVIFLDVDKLKYINDSLGHENGDALITNI